MFGSDGIQLLRRVAGIPQFRDRPDQRLPLRSEHFPVEARGREIVTQEGGHDRGRHRSRDERGDSSTLER